MRNEYNQLLNKLGTQEQLTVAEAMRLSELACKLDNIRIFFCVPRTITENYEVPEEIINMAKPSWYFIFGNYNALVPDLIHVVGFLPYEEIMKRGRLVKNGKKSARTIVITDEEKKVG